MQEQHAPETATEESASSFKPKKSLSTLVVVGTVCVIAILAFLVITTRDTGINTENSESWRSSLRDSNDTAATEVTRYIYPDNTDYSIYYKNINREPGIEWFLNPVPLGDLGLITENKYIDADGDYIDQISYYFQIGNFNDKPIVYVNADCSESVCIGEDLFFLGTTTSDVSLIKTHSQFDENTNFYKLHEGVSIDENLSFDALRLNEISLGQATFTVGSRFFRLEHPEIFANSSFNPNVEGEREPYEFIEFIEDTEFGPLFRGYNISEEGTAIFMYAVRTVGGLLVPFELDLPKKLFSAESYPVPDITWNDGSKNTKEYSTGFHTSGQEISLKDIPQSDLEVVGKTSNGRKIYNLISPEHPLITRVTGKEPNTFVEYDEKTGELRGYTLTAQELIVRRGVLVFIDDLGFQNILTYKTSI